MIHIDRNRLDAGGQPIQPDATWQAKADEATRTARAGQEVDRNIYAHDQVKAALEALFYDKCAYCETDVTAGFDWDVEHFRPKGKIAERDGHPGYYWLAYTWTNLYLSCQHCNQHRKDRPRWGDRTNASAGGKMDQFPLEDESTRALGPLDDPKREKRLLLDPCEDRPEEHLRYTADGQIVAVAGSRRGETSIEVFFLRRRRLRDQRRRKVREVVDLLKIIRKHEDEGNADAARDFRRFLETWYLADSCEYAGAARAVERDPEAFGV